MKRLFFIGLIIVPTILMPWGISAWSALLWFSRKWAFSRPTHPTSLFHHYDKTPWAVVYISDAEYTLNNFLVAACVGSVVLSLIVGWFVVIYGKRFADRTNFPFSDD
jgi:hypothetical protein